MNKLFIAGLAVLLFGCSYFPESSFKLARESRLPKWFTLPAGVSRSDVTVTMDYYIEQTRRTARFTLLNVKTGQELAKVNGTQKGMHPFRLKGQLQEPLTYPGYEIVTVNGITEVMEHRRLEPIFYITDDPSVLSELGVSGAHL